MNNADKIDRVNKRAPRRKHSAELRAKLLRACKQPGASVAEIAQLHELNANVVHRWRVDERNAVASGIDKSQSGFLGVNILPEIQATPESVLPADIRVEVRGWEKGSVEKNVRDRRTSIWHRAKDRRWTDWAELNAWLAEQSKAAWAELNHPEYPAMKVAEALQDEQTQLMPVSRPFDGYVELLARVSSTSLIHLERNRYSVPTEHANSVVSLRIYHDHIAAVADGVRVAAHQRCFDRSQTLYDWQHYISLLERKPGGLRSGAPFATMPAAFKQLQAILMRKSGGDAVMAQALAAVPVHGLDAVLVAAELALESSKPSGEHVLNVLARLNSNMPAGNLGEDMAAELA